MVDLADLITDLDAETADLARRVAPLGADAWALPTPAEGWTVAHQIAHLAWTDNAALLAATDEDAFWAALSADMSGDPAHFVDRGTETYLAPPDVLLARWRDGHGRLVEALRAADPKARLPWFGTTMSPASMATARIMETWAHGKDVADALGQERAPTARLRHIAYLGFRTLGHSFATHDRAAPAVPVRVELAAPDGGTWAFGPEDAADRVTGTAQDFCLLVTQRGSRKGSSLVATGPVADEWLDIAQAFAGPPGAGREAGAS